MTLKKTIVVALEKVSGWKLDAEPLPDKVVVIGAPHTSNWDGVFMTMAFWKLGRPFNFLVKDSLVRNPVTGPVVRAIGGIGVNRKRSNGLVGEIVEACSGSDQFTLAMTPKGTRSRRDYWKSGFYRICLEAGIPMQLGYVNSVTKTYGWGPTLMPSGDVEADMAIIRDFYKDMRGVKPELTSVPRLRAEDDPQARAHLLGE